MKFNEMSYQRPDMDQVLKQCNHYLDGLKNASSFMLANEAFVGLLELINQVETMAVLTSIRNSANVDDAFYKAEQDFFDENSPRLDSVVTQCQTAILASTFKDDFEKAYGSHYITVLDYSSKLMNEEVVPLLIEENKLATRYNQLISKAKTTFNGETLPLTRMMPFMKNESRDVRKAANEAYFSFFKDNQKEVEDIYQSLIKVRVEIAQKMGYENYVDYAYVMRCRYDYKQADVQKLREAVKKFIVPVIVELEKQKEKRLGIDHAMYYDYPMTFDFGDVSPVISEAEMVPAALKMYQELSPETGEFFEFMVNNELLDLSARDGKRPGGYCTFIKNHKAPYIFSNFNGTSGDVDVLTHEAGHAFDVFTNRYRVISEYIWGGYDVAEIHSMSMEFFTYPWMPLFFKDKEKAYRFEHVIDNLKFIPYGLLVDDFQHHVFHNPNMTPSEINATWRRLEKEYMPMKDYSDNAFLDEGTFWFKQAHIFVSPFYYLDYVVAQLTAFQFFIKMQTEPDAFKDYQRLVSMGGTLPFVALLEENGLTSPFNDQTILRIIEGVQTYLTQFDF